MNPNLTEQPNHQSRAIFWLLIAVAAIMWIGSAPFLDSSGPNMPAMFLFGSMMFNCCAAGAWLGLGSSHWRWLLSLVTPVILGVGVSIAITSVSLSVATVINIWAIHGKQLTPTKMLVAFVVTCCAMLANYFAMERFRWFFPSVVLICQTLAIALMLSFRMQGYRFVKRVPGQKSNMSPPVEI